MLRALLGLAFAAFAAFAALACFFQLVTGHHDGSVSRDQANEAAAHKRDRALRRARICAIAAGVCLIAAFALGAALQLA